MKKLTTMLLMLSWSVYGAAATTDDTFEKDLAKDGMTVVVVGQRDCMSCDAFQGEIPAVERGIEAKFVTLDTEKNKKSASSVSNLVTTFPTLVVYKNGKAVGSCRGGNHRDVIRRLRRILKYAETKKDTDNPLKDDEL